MVRTLFFELNLKKIMKKQITYLSIFLISLTTLQGQIVQERLPGAEEISNRRTSFNLDEIKVRWKKAALENCTGVPCVVAPSFTCGTSTVSDIDGNAYNTVLIGTQCWTKSNLKVTKYNDGTLIPDLTASTSNPWAPAGARTGYNGGGVTLSDYVGTFGYLYNWYAVNDSRKLCPDGWHVPTDAEWTNLIRIYDPGASASVAGAQSTTAGAVLKSNVTNTSAGVGLGWNPGNPGTNTSGFSALPGGYRTDSGSFGGVRGGAFLWSATENSLISNSAWYRDLGNGWTGVGRGFFTKSFGASVRCLKD